MYHHIIVSGLQYKTWVIKTITIINTKFSVNEDYIKQSLFTKSAHVVDIRHYFT